GRQLCENPRSGTGLKEKIRVRATREGHSAGRRLAGRAHESLRQLEETEDLVTAQALQRQQVTQLAGRVALLIAAGVRGQGELPLGRVRSCSQVSRIS